MLAAGWRRTGITLPDVALTGALATLSVLLGWLAKPGWFGERSLDPPGALLLTLSVLPVLVRRRWPLPALLVSCAVNAPYHKLDYPHEVALPAVLVLIYSVAVLSSRVWLLVVLVLVSMPIAVVAMADQTRGPYLALPLGWVLLAAMLGVAIRLHRTNVSAGRQSAVAAERLRIARDLHDALAHNIVVINAHAAVAAHLLAEHRDDPVVAGVAEPLETVAAASSAALAELRATLDVLRGNEADHERQPTPGVERLPDLVATTGAAGVRVRMRTEGRPWPLSPSVSITLYRIAQEALTNVVKHAGTAEAELLLSYAGGEVRLAVTDRGPGTPAPPDGRGYGIIGMIERAGAVGGTLTASARAGGGFAVTAVLPARVTEAAE